MTKYSFSFSKTISNTLTHIVSMLVSEASKQLLNEYVLTWRKPHLKWATVKRKNMLPIGSIFFPLKVAPMTIENSF